MKERPDVADGDNVVGERHDGVGRLESGSRSKGGDHDAGGMQVRVVKEDSKGFLGCKLAILSPSSRPRLTSVQRSEVKDT